MFELTHRYTLSSVWNFDISIVRFYNFIIEDTWSWTHLIWRILINDKFGNWFEKFQSLAGMLSMIVSDYVSNVWVHRVRYFFGKQLLSRVRIELLQTWPISKSIDLYSSHLNRKDDTSIFHDRIRKEIIEERNRYEIIRGSNIDRMTYLLFRFVLMKSQNHSDCDCPSKNPNDFRQHLNQILKVEILPKMIRDSPVR